MIIKINNFRADLTDISTKTATLHVSQHLWGTWQNCQFLQRFDRKEQVCWYLPLWLILMLVDSFCKMVSCHKTTHSYKLRPQDRYQQVSWVCWVVSGWIPVRNFASCLASSSMRAWKAGSVTVLTNVIKASLEVEWRVASVHEQIKRQQIHLVAVNKIM